MTLIAGRSVADPTLVGELGAQRYLVFLTYGRIWRPTCAVVAPQPVLIEIEKSIGANDVSESCFASKADSQKIPSASDGESTICMAVSLERKQFERSSEELSRIVRTPRVGR